MNAIAHYGKRWIAVGGSDIFYSDDASSWRRARGKVHNLRKLEYGDHRWLAIGDGAVATSTNGSDWDDVSFRTGRDPRAAANDGERWLVVGENAALLIEPRIAVPAVSDVDFRFSPADVDRVTTAFTTR